MSDVRIKISGKSETSELEKVISWGCGFVGTADY